MSAGIPGRVPKALTAVEARAVGMWAAVNMQPEPETERAMCVDAERRLFGMGELLTMLGQDCAAGTAFFLASLAGHRSRGDFASVTQRGLFND